MIYGKGCGFCMEPHYFPNSINTKEFDAPVFDAGEVYQTVTMYQFVTKED